MVETSNHESCKVDHEMIIIPEHSSAIVDLDEILIGNHRQLSVISCGFRCDLENEYHMYANFSWPVK